MAEDDEVERDLALIRALAGVLTDTDLAEIEIERGSARFRVSRASQVQTTVAAPAPAMPAPQAAAPSAAPAAPAAGANDAAPKSAADHPGAVPSPMVGTAYLSPSPGAQPFVTVGSQVTEGQTVMIVEAMKTLNEIKAPRAGKVSEILARDAEPVEFGEPLMIIE